MYGTEHFIEKKETVMEIEWHTFCNDMVLHFGKMSLILSIAFKQGKVTWPFFTLKLEITAQSWSNVMWREVLGL